jgi:hypothetical protein
MVVAGSAILQRSYRCWSIPFMVVDGTRHLLLEGQKLCRRLNEMAAGQVEAFVRDDGPRQYMKEAVRVSDRERKMRGKTRDR